MPLTVVATAAVQLTQKSERINAMQPLERGFSRVATNDRASYAKRFLCEYLASAVLFNYIGDMCEVRVRALSRELAAKAALELNENPAEVAEYLSALRNWVVQQTHLRTRSCDQFLIVFLRAGKFSLERAKQKLSNYYTYRALLPDLFRNRDLDDPKVYEIIKSGSLLYLPIPIAADGPRIAMIRPNCFDMEKYSIPDVFKVGTMIADILIYEEDNAFIAGYVLIMDLANLSKSVVLNFDPNFVKKLTIMINKVSPSRMKGFHFLNVPTLFEKLFNMVKSVINAKLRERFYVHSSKLDTLYEHIPRHVLPKEYGGALDLSSIQAQMWRMLCEHKHFLKEEESYGVIQSASADDCNSSHMHCGDVFGTQGSFRKLNID